MAVQTVALTVNMYKSSLSLILFPHGEVGFISDTQTLLSKYRAPQR